MALVEELERVGHRVDNSLGTEIRATDTDADNNISNLAQLCSLSVDCSKMSLVNLRRKGNPAQEVATLTITCVEQLICSDSLALNLITNFDTCLAGIKLNQFHNVYLLLV